ncbi:MAG TPA: membrane protein insertase YidC, partial [Candidatus Deferrimicrobiaceae bacterium]|nr:membrane protein insertase YidC [Candidatus Deferrimicrobiaceae bacterium]
AQKVTNGEKGSLRFRPGMELSQIFEGELGGDSYSFKGAVVNSGGKINQLDLKKISKGGIEKGPARWAAADAKYFTLVVIPEKEWSLERVALLGENGIRIALAGSSVVLGPREVLSFSARSFMGPKEYNLLEAAGKNLEQLVDYGWFSVIAKPLVWLLAASNRVTGNYGIDIIILTIIIKILFYPLTQKSMASMKKMQELAPILNKIKEKYKDDKARQQQEMMNLYKTYKINPMSGCLPMLLQIPVFIALYKGLLVAIELRHAPFLLWIDDLSAPEHLWDIAVAGYTIPIRLLPLLMGISMFVQQKLSPSGGMDPTQQKMMLFLPVIFTFMFWGFPTGLTIYWLMNNLLSIGQQLIQNRQAKAEKAARAQA